jgi:hypothetical protein
MDPNVMEGVLTPQDIFNLKVDTQARWDKITSMKNNFDVPSPKFASYDFNRDPLDRNSQMNIYDGLFSNDHDIKEAAKKAIADGIDNDPAMKYNTGFKIDTPLEQAKPYYNKEYGFDPTRDNAQFYYEHEYADKSFLGKVADNTYKGIGRFVGGVATKLGQTIGHLGAMIGYGLLETGDWVTGKNNNHWIENVAENSFTKWFEKAEETIKDDWMPVFKPSNWNDKGFWEKLGSGQYWSDDLSDGAAFMGAMIAESYIGGALGRFAGLGNIASKTITGSSNLAKLTRAALRMSTGAEDLGGVGTWALSVGGESMFEASSLYKNVKQQLKDDRESGKNTFTDEKIDEIAGDRAAASFRGNLAVLSLSNAFENRFIFQPLMKKLRGKATFNAAEEPSELAKGIKLAETTPKTDLDNFAKAEYGRPEYTGKLDRYLNIRKKLKDPLGSLRFYGTRALEAAVVEGYWEENAQLAIERLATNGNLNMKSFVNQYFGQISDATKGKDKNAADSIGAGAVIGILGTAGTSAVTRERRKLKEETLKAIKTYEGLRKQYLSFQSAYEKDADGNFIKDEQTGDYKINPDKAKAILSGLDEHLAKQTTVDNLKDPIFRRFMQDQLLASYTFAAKQAGIHEAVAERFENLGKLGKEQLAKLGFDPNTNENIPAFQQSFKEQSKIYDEVFLSKEKVKQPKGVDDKTLEQNDWERKSELYGLLTSAKSTRRALNDYTEIGAQQALDENKNLVSPFQLHNSIDLQIYKLQKFLRQLPKDSHFFDKYVEQEIQRLSKERDQYRLQIAEIQAQRGIGEIFDTDVDYDKYSKYFTEDGNLIEEKRDEMLKEFMADRVDAAKHAELTNSLTQMEYTAKKLADRKDGYNNYEDYKKHKAAISTVDDEVDEEEAPQEEKDDKVKEQEEIEAEKQRKAEEKQKADEEAAKVKADEEKAKAEHEAWRKANPIPAKLQDIKDALTAFANESTIPEEAKKAIHAAVQGDNAISDFLKVIQPLFESLTDDEKEFLHQVALAIEEYNDLLKNDKGAQQEEPQVKEPEPAPVVSPEEKVLEVQLGKQKADEARAFVKEMLENDLIPESFKAIAETSPLGFLQMVAEQAQAELNGISNRPSTVTTFGDTIVGYAEELFPAQNKQVENKEQQLDTKNINNSLSGFKLEANSNITNSFTIHKNGEKVGLVLLNIDKDGNVRISYMEVFDKFRRKGIAEKFYKDLNNALVLNNYGVLHSDSVWLDDESKREKRKWFLDGKQLTEEEISKLKKDTNKLLQLDEEGRLTYEAEKRSDILPAKKLWEKLVNQGVAEKLDDGTYRFKLVKQEPKSNLTPAALEALEEAWGIQQKADEQIKTYEELLRELGYYQSENKIDEAVDNGKMAGKIVVPTMRPNEIKPDGSLTVSEKLYLQARFNFLQRLSDTGTDGYKLILFVDNKGNLKGKVADTNNNILKIDTNGQQSEKGVEVIFDLDLISYNTQSLPKERIEASGKKQNPIFKALKNFKLHESFNNNVNVDKQVVNYIKNSPNVVTASIDLVTQGQLLRPGITNDPNSLTDLSGKRKSLAKLQEEGRVYKNENGKVAKDNLTENNIFVKSGRLNVRLKRNVNNEADGFEIVEFIPRKLSEMVDNTGKSVKTKMKDILQKAIDGQLPSEYEEFLKKVLNRREYLILNLGSVVFVTNREKFKNKLGSLEEAKSADLLAEEILKLTSLDEVMDSNFNIDASLYQDTEDYQATANDYPDDVQDLILHYQDVVKHNVTSSAKEAKVGDNKQGFVRVNKRLVVSLDKTFEEMKNDKLRKDQETVSNPEKTEIKIEQIDKDAIIKIFSSDEEVDLDQALNDLNC